MPQKNRESRPIDGKTTHDACTVGQQEINKVKNRSETAAFVKADNEFQRKAHTAYTLRLTLAPRVKETAYEYFTQCKTKQKAKWVIGLYAIPREFRNSKRHCFVWAFVKKTISSFLGD